MGSPRRRDPTRELKRHGIDVIDRSTVTHIDTGVNMGALVHYTSARTAASPSTSPKANSCSSRSGGIR